MCIRDSLNIFCFNVESMPELVVLNELAAKKGKTAQVALRINPNVDAHTHEYITTGLNENKFGFSMAHLDLSLIHISTVYIDKIGNCGNQSRTIG